MNSCDLMFVSFGWMRSWGVWKLVKAERERAN